MIMICYHYHQTPLLLYFSPDPFTSLFLSHREGYPGVIIEAFALGIPIIATKLSGIMEMCEDNKNALLIDVKQPQQLYKAIKSIDQTLYDKLHKEATKSFTDFNSEIQTDLFLEKINYYKERK